MQRSTTQETTVQYVGVCMNSLYVISRVHVALSILCYVTYTICVYIHCTCAHTQVIMVLTYSLNNNIVLSSNLYRYMQENDLCAYNIIVCSTILIIPLQWPFMYNTHVHVVFWKCSYILFPEQLRVTVLYCMSKISRFHISQLPIHVATVYSIHSEAYITTSACQ